MQGYPMKWAGNHGKFECPLPPGGTVRSGPFHMYQSIGFESGAEDEIFSNPNPLHIMTLRRECRVRHPFSLKNTRERGTL